MDRHLADEQQTLDFGCELAAGLESGTVIALCGGLGAGKTCFTKGLLAGLGSAAAVTSPTFTLVHEYRGGRLEVAHFDFYRMASPAELLAAGWDDYLDHADLVVAEWADRFPELLPSHTRWLQFDRDGGGRVVRQINAPSTGRDQ